MADDSGSHFAPAPNQSMATTQTSPRAASPFIGMAGRGFLRLCVWLDAAFPIRNNPYTQTASEKELLAGRHLPHSIGTHSYLGTALCIVAASCLTALFYSSSFKNVLPIAFLGIVVLMTLMFGREAGIFGTLCAALIFASVLFEPRPSLAIEDPAAQTHLMWMVVIGVVLADLLGRESRYNSPSWPPDAVGMPSQKTVSDTDRIGGEP